MVAKLSECAKNTESVHINGVNCKEHELYLNIVVTKILMANNQLGEIFVTYLDKYSSSRCIRNT